MTLLVTSVVFCKSYTPLKYKIRAETVTNPTEKASCQNTLYERISYYENEKLKIVLNEKNYLLELIFERPQDLLDNHNFLINNKQEKKIRLPEILAIKLFFLNRHENNTSVDTAGFFLKDSITQKIIKPLTIQEYELEFYNRGMWFLEYRWAFQRRDSWSFLYPVPGWALQQKKINMTSSDLENERIKNAVIEQNERLRRKNSIVRPGGESWGYILFPLPDVNRLYQLKYEPSKMRDSEIRHKNIKLPSFCFVLKRVKEKPDSDPKVAAISEKEKRAKRLDKNMYKILKSRHAEYREMHRQRLKHWQLSNPGSEN